MDYWGLLNVFKHSGVWLLGFLLAHLLACLFFFSISFFSFLSGTKLLCVMKPWFVHPGTGHLLNKQQDGKYVMSLETLIQVRWNIERPTFQSGIHVFQTLSKSILAFLCVAKIIRYFWHNFRSINQSGVWCKKVLATVSIQYTQALSSPWAQIEEVTIVNIFFKIVYAK